MQHCKLPDRASRTLKAMPGDCLRSQSSRSNPDLLLLERCLPQYTSSFQMALLASSQCTAWAGSALPGGLQHPDSTCLCFQVREWGVLVKCLGGSEEGPASKYTDSLSRLCRA